MRKNFGVKPWFYPLPVLIIGTYDEKGQANAMNAAWGGLYDSDKIILCLSENHKTTKNIKTKKAFTVSFGDKEHVVACDYVGLVSANTVSNKLEKAGLSTEKSMYVDAPVICELPVAIECRYIKTTEDGNIIGEIVNISVDDNVLGEDGLIDVEKLNVISFDPVHNDYLVLGQKVGKAFKDGESLK